MAKGTKNAVASATEAKAGDTGGTTPPDKPKGGKRTASAKKVDPAIPRLFSVTGSLIPGTAYLYGVKSDGTAVPVLLEKETQLGAVAAFSNVYENDLSYKKPSEDKEKDPRAPNIQTMDVCRLPRDCEKLRIRYGLVVAANSIEPSACSNFAFRRKISAFFDAYGAAGGFDDLARRYLWNLGNGRTIWRNSDIQTDISATVVLDRKLTVRFEDCQAIERDVFDHSVTEIENFEEAARMIGKALSSKSRRPLPISVVIEGSLEGGMPVFPSEEFVRKEEQKPRPGEPKRGRILRSEYIDIGGHRVRQAVMSTQKIGNAIRTIDEWHGSPEVGTIAVEIFGYSKQYMEAFRLPSEGVQEEDRSFYRLIAKVDELTERLKTEGTFGDAHYVAALMMRGGVLSSGKEKEDKEEKAKDATKGTDAPAADGPDQSQMAA